MIRRRGWIGVDIGARNVKLAQLERRGETVRLREATVIPRVAPWESLPPQPTSAHHSGDELSAARGLAKRFLGRRSATALPMAACQLSELSLEDAGKRRKNHVAAGGPRGEHDSGPTGQVHDLIRRQMRDRGLIAAHRVGDYWMTPLTGSLTFAENGDGAGLAASATVLSASVDWSWRMLNDQRQAGLLCKVVDGLPMVLARAAALSPWGAQEAPLAVLDWGFSNAVMCVVHHGRPVFVRRLRRAGVQAIARPLRERFSIYIDEAEMLLRRYGIPPAQPNFGPNPILGAENEVQRHIEGAVEEPLLNFVSEIRRTCEFLGHRREGLAPTRLCLLGGGATIKNIAARLESKIQLPVNLWRLRDVAAGGPEGQDSLPPSVTHSESVLWAVPAALSALAWRPKQIWAAKMGAST